MSYYFDPTDARRVALQAVQWWREDSEHYSQRHDGPVSLAVDMADDWWAAVNGWPVSGLPPVKVQGYTEWIEAVREQAESLTKGAQQLCDQADAFERDAVDSDEWRDIAGDRL